MATASGNYGFNVGDLILQNRIQEPQLLEFRDWVDRQNLPNYPDETLALFLIATKNNINKAKQRITMYYNCRKDGPEIFNDRDITSEELKFTLQVLDYVIVPRRTDENNVVIINRLHSFNVKDYNFILAIKLLFMVVDAAMHDDPPNGNTSERDVRKSLQFSILCLGVIAVYDMNGTALGHFFKASFSSIRKFINYTQHGFPIYIKSVHILNITWFIGRIVRVIRPLTRHTGPQITNYHRSDMNMEAFYLNYIPQECLPSDYGGTQDSMEELHELTVKKLFEMQQFFADEQHLRYVFESETLFRDHTDDFEAPFVGNRDLDTVQDDSHSTIGTSNIYTIEDEDHVHDKIYITIEVDNSFTIEKVSNYNNEIDNNDNSTIENVDNNIENKNNVTNEKVVKKRWKKFKRKNKK